MISDLLILNIFDGILLKYFICLRVQVVHQWLQKGRGKGSSTYMYNLMSMNETTVSRAVANGYRVVTITHSSVQL